MKGPLLLLAHLATACLATACADPAPDALGALLRRPAVAGALAHAQEKKVQIVLGTLAAGADGRPALHQHGYRAGEEYLYPASSVKLFAAVAALERLHELAAASGLPIDADTTLRFHPLFPGEELAEWDESNRVDGRITVRQEIRKLCLVSDNEAFNRLYELVGQDRLAASLARAGLAGIRIVHRLEELRSPEENRRSPRIDFVGEGWSFTLAERLAPALPPAPALPGLAIGRGFMRGGQVVQEPMDFAGKNRAPLLELQRGLCKVLLPAADCGPGQAFRLDADDHALLAEALRQYPRESQNPTYTAGQYPDAWGKLFLPGLERVLGRGAVEVSNKFGQAYGFSIDNAWLFEPAGGRGLFLAASVYTNADGMLNDDRYEYQAVALPFFEALGEAAADLFSRGALPAPPPPAR